MANKVQTKATPAVLSHASIGINSVSVGHPTRIDTDMPQGTNEPPCAGSSRDERRVGGWSQIEEDWLQIEKTIARSESCRVEMQRVMFLAPAALGSHSARQRPQVGDKPRHDRAVAKEFTRG